MKAITDLRMYVVRSYYVYRINIGTRGGAGTTIPEYQLMQVLWHRCVHYTQQTTFSHPIHSLHNFILQSCKCMHDSYPGLVHLPFLQNL